MIMPNETMQREMARARLARFARRPNPATLAERERTARRPETRSLRVQLGHALIGAGTRLSGERGERVRPSAHRPA